MCSLVSRAHTHIYTQNQVLPLHAFIYFFFILSEMLESIAPNNPLLCYSAFNLLCFPPENIPIAHIKAWRVYRWMTLMWLHYKDDNSRQCVSISAMRQLPITGDVHGSPFPELHPPLLSYWQTHSRCLCRSISSNIIFSFLATFLLNSASVEHLSPPNLTTSYQDERNEKQSDRSNKRRP